MIVTKRFIQKLSNAKNLNELKLWFYKSREWKRARAIAIDKSELLCWYCNKAIVTGQLEVHHIEWLDKINYKDINKLLSQDNLGVVHIKCHNKIHSKGYNVIRLLPIVNGITINYKERDKL